MDDSFWDFYWETRLQFLQGQGKGLAIQAASALLRSRSQASVRILELGCGEGQILGSLQEAHPEKIMKSASLGVDRDGNALVKARLAYPSLRFEQGSFTDADYLATLGPFDLILLVNALHHSFSDAYDDELGEINISAGKKAVSDTFHAIRSCLAPGGQILIFDGIEPSLDLNLWVEFRFSHAQAKENFEQFVREYRSLRIQSQPGSHAYTARLSLRHFTRYITKMIFIGKHLWPREREESYQYFNRAEFEMLFHRNGLRIHKFQTISVDHPRWQEEIEILTPGIDFPEEHVLLVGGD